jgi:hypothetical protein
VDISWLLELELSLGWEAFSEVWILVGCFDVGHISAYWCSSSTLLNLIDVGGGAMSLVGGGNIALGVSWGSVTDLKRMKFCAIWSQGRGRSR